MIAYLTSQYPAPSHTFIRREVAALRARGVPVATCSIRRPEVGARLAPEDEAEAARTHYVLPPSIGAVLAALGWALLFAPGRFLEALRLSLRHRVPGVRALVYAFFYFAEAMMVARCLRRMRVTHLHNHFANPAANVGLLAACYLRLPWSLTLHGISEFDYPAGVLLPQKIAAARFVACVSHFGRAQAMRLISPDLWPRLFLCRCSVDTRRLAFVPRSVRETPIVVCVGRLSPEKGHIGLLEAYAKVRAVGLRAQLRLVGDGPERPRIEAAIRAMGIAKECVLVGQRSEDETLEEIRTADILVSASFMEGLPVVLIEALALGAAAIAPRVAGIPELIEDGKTGLLFHPGDWDGLAECLERLLRSSELRVSLARAGRARVEAEFDTEVAVEPLLARLAPGRSGTEITAPGPILATG